MRAIINELIPAARAPAENPRACDAIKVPQKVSGRYVGSRCGGAGKKNAGIR